MHLELLTLALFNLLKNVPQKFVDYCPAGANKATNGLSNSRKSLTKALQRHLVLRKPYKKVISTRLLQVSI